MSWQRYFSGFCTLIAANITRSFIKASCAEIPWNNASPGLNSRKYAPTTCTGHVRGHSLHQQLRTSLLPVGLFLRLQHKPFRYKVAPNTKLTYEASTPTTRQTRSFESLTADHHPPILQLPPSAMLQMAASTGRCSKSNIALRSVSPLGCPDKTDKHKRTATHATQQSYPSQFQQSFNAIPLDPELLPGREPSRLSNTILGTSNRWMLEYACVFFG